MIRSGLRAPATSSVHNPRCSRQYFIPIHHSWGSRADLGLKAAGKHPGPDVPNRRWLFFPSTPPIREWHGVTRCGDSYDAERAHVRHLGRPTLPETAAPMRCANSCATRPTPPVLAWMRMPCFAASCMHSARASRIVHHRIGNVHAPKCPAPGPSPCHSCVSVSRSRPGARLRRALSLTLPMHMHMHMHNMHIDRAAHTCACTCA